MAFNQFPLPQQTAHLCQILEPPPSSSYSIASGAPSQPPTETPNGVVMQHGLAQQGPGGIPAHPHLLPMRQSRKEPCLSPNSEGLSAYKNNLLHVLNAERWGNHRSAQQMEQELAQCWEEIGTLRHWCGSWAHAWTECNDELLRSESDRIRLLNDLVALRRDMQMLQSSQHALLAEHAEAQRKVCLDMNSAKDRQITVLRRKLSRQQSPSTANPSSNEHDSAEEFGQQLSERQPHERLGLSRSA